MRGLYFFAEIFGKCEGWLDFLGCVIYDKISQEMEVNEMKHTYEKPVITVDAGMAEGVYAASGAEDTTGISYSTGDVIADWGGSGQANFTLTLSNANPSQLTVVLTFNMDISGAWGGSASSSVSGKAVTLTWYSAPASATITVQANGTIKDLEIKNATYSNN